MSRLDEIEERAKALPFGAPFVVHQPIPPWLTAATMNEIRSLVTDDIPYLLAELRAWHAWAHEAEHPIPQCLKSTEGEHACECGLDKLLAGEA